MFLFICKTLVLVAGGRASCLHMIFSVGFALGPLVWAPASEVWGRRISMLPAMCCLAFFSLGSATSRNAQSIFLTRFFSGLFGSAAVSNVNAALGDIWSRESRGIAVTFYGIAVVGGPMIGPVLGAAILVNQTLDGAGRNISQRYSTPPLSY